MGRKKITNYLIASQNDSRKRVEENLKILECDTAVNSLFMTIKKAEEEKLPYVDFLDILLDQEMRKRESDRIERWKKQARFPWMKDLKMYDFSHPTFIEKDKVERLSLCDWIENGTNVIFFGVPGVGKTHLSIALGIEAIKKGYETRFVSVDHLTEMISVAIKKDRINDGVDHRKKLLSTFSNFRLLILDELAYSKISKEVADFLFQLIRRRYDLKVSTIFTSNEGVNKWEKYFDNNQERAGAALDCILEKCEAISISGDSFRSKSFRLNL